MFIVNVCQSEPSNTLGCFISYLSSKVIELLHSSSELLECTAAAKESQKLCHVSGFPENVVRVSLGRHIVNWGVTLVGICGEFGLGS